MLVVRPCEYNILQSQLITFIVVNKFVSSITYLASYYHDSKKIEIDEWEKIS